MERLTRCVYGDTIGIRDGPTDGNIIGNNDGCSEGKNKCDFLGITTVHCWDLLGTSERNNDGRPLGENRDGEPFGQSWKVKQSALRKKQAQADAEEAAAEAKRKDKNMEMLKKRVGWK